MARATAAALIATACLVLVSLPSTHLQALASTIPDSSSSSHEQRQALNYLMYQSTGTTTTPSQEGANSSTSSEDFIKSLLKDVNHDHTSDRIDLKLATNIWKRMHQNALEFAQVKTNQARPIVDQFLQVAGVSAKCRAAIGATMDHLGRLDGWAMKMYNSFGELPTVGFFEGTMTSMGSYYQCVNVAPNQWIDRPQYCSFKFQPIIPKRPRYHNILETIDESLVNFTSKDDVSFAPEPSL